ncbi:hypothetical protein ACJJIQ_00310 [Microbulbifer sp. ANSA003]|uniref:hypothetical protein n=1 Tax=Microbulbifer sp. ANSA003 TaxID=3243360 RepID=UPI00404158E0
MDLDQRAAERAFRKWGKPATYTDGSGAEPIDCRVIKDQEVDEFEEGDRLRVARIELSLLVSEVGAYNSDAVTVFYTHYLSPFKTSAAST